MSFPESVIQVDANTFTYRGNSVSVYGTASEYNNMSVEGWIGDEEHSPIYGEGYNSYAEAVRAVVDDTIRRFGSYGSVEQIEFV